MPVIEDHQGAGTRYPVIKRTAIGEHFIAAYVKHEMRDVQGKDGSPVLHDRGRNVGKPKKEVVVHLVAMPGTTSPASAHKDEDPKVPEPGDIVRLILKSMSLKQWIDGQGALRGVKRAGDVVEFTTTTAQAYDDDGPRGEQMTTQEQVTKARLKGLNLGVYGDLIVRAATTSELPWVHKADEALATLKAGPTVNDNDMDEPF